MQAEAKALRPAAARLFYDHYCPLHEFDWWECDRHCSVKKAMLKGLQAEFSEYWWEHGYSFKWRPQR